MGSQYRAYCESQALELDGHDAEVRSSDMQIIRRPYVDAARESALLDEVAKRQQVKVLVVTPVLLHKHANEIIQGQAFKMGVREHW